MQELIKGRKYTIGPSRTYEDRSYTRGVHIVQALNDTHVQTRYFDERYAARTLVLIRNEHSFSPADDFELPTGHFDPTGMEDAPLDASSETETAPN